MKITSAKKIIALLLSLILVLSFAACKSDKDDVDSGVSSATSSDSDVTQDWDKEDDKWGNDAPLTDEEREEIEDLWNDLVENSDAEIVASSSSSSKDSSSVISSTNKDESGTSSVQSSSSSNTSSDAASSEDDEDLNGDVVVSVPTLP